MFRAGQLVRGFRTFSRGLQQKNNFAFAFDIDGVLIRGAKQIPEAPAALSKLNERSVPYILLTNGGGKTEQERVDDLSKTMGNGINISERQFLQSHTPYKSLVGKYNRVLVVGGDEDKCRYVAQSYGFKDVVLPVDIVRQVGNKIWPFNRYHPQDLEKWGRSDVDVHSPFDAVLVFCDPRDMGTDTQIVLDLLLSENGRLGTRRPNREFSSKPAIPIHFSNNDLLWANNYVLPRFGQGAFRAIVQGLYKETTKYELDCHIIGKPYRYTYEYADNLLKNWSNSSTSDDDFTVYMVGDNPASDIMGANNYGWKSMLVRTGVYNENDRSHIVATPDYFFDNVLDCVEFVLDKHK